MKKWKTICGEKCEQTKNVNKSCDDKLKKSSCNWAVPSSAEAGVRHVLVLNQKQDKLL